MAVIDVIIQCLFIFFSTIGFSIIFNVKSSELVYCGFTGLVCFILYKFVNDFYDQEFLAIIVGVFVASCMSRKLAYIRKMPVTLYVIPAIIPLAPGGAVYLTMYNIIFQNYAETLRYSFTVMKIAGGIVIGMTIALSLPYKWFNKSILKKER